MGIKDKKWFQTLMGIAPTVATALGGPFAGLAVGVLKKTLGLPENAGEDEVAAAIAAGDMETLQKLKQAELDFKTKMRELDLKEDQLYLQDTADARARHIAVKDSTPAILAALGWVQWAFVLVVILFGDKFGLDFAGEERDILFFVLATAQAIVLQGFNFFLGSSRGSKQKTDAFERFILNGKREGDIK